MTTAIIAAVFVGRAARRNLPEARGRIGDVDQFPLGHLWLFIVVLVVGLWEVFEDGVDAGHGELGVLVVHHVVRVCHGGRCHGGGGGRENERMSCGWMQLGGGGVGVFFTYTSANDMSAVNEECIVEMVGSDSNRFARERH